MSSVPPGKATIHGHVHRPPDSDPPPPVPYFRALPEPHWRVIDAVAAGLPPAA